MINQNSLRVLHVSTAETWRGGEQQLVYLYEELASLDVEQKILCLQDSALAQYCHNHKLNYSTLSNPHISSLSSIGRYRHIIRKNSPDIIHVHDSHAHSIAALCSRLFFIKIPIVVSRRVDFMVKNNRISKYKYDGPWIKKIICVSNAIEKMLMPVMNHPKKLVTIHDGIDLNKFSMVEKKQVLRKEYSLKENEWIIGTIAALVDHKDLFTFINMAKCLVDKNIPAKFFIIGEGELKAELMQYAVSQGMEKHVFFTGFRTDVKSLLLEFDGFVSSSKQEGLGSSILDAMQAGVPVVATQAGGIPEIVVHNETGLLAPIKNAPQLAEAVRQILENATLKDRLVHCAKQWVKNFDKKLMAEKTHAIYRKSLSFDLEYHRALETTLSEWASTEDDEAYKKIDIDLSD